MHDPRTVAWCVVRPWPERTSFKAADGGVRWKVLHQHKHGRWCQDPETGCLGTRNPFPWWKPGSWSRFWRLAGRDFYWPAWVTVWHQEPGGADGLSVCSRRVQRNDGTWHMTRGWRWHVHHYRIQVHPVQNARRRLLTRCAWCHGKSTPAEPVNHSRQWDPVRSPWWRGELGLFHSDCLSVERAHGLCLCADPLLERPSVLYGRCIMCGKFRPYNYTPTTADRLLADLPLGSRVTDAVRPALEAAWAERKAAEKAANDQESS